MYYSYGEDADKAAVMVAATTATMVTAKDAPGNLHAELQVLVASVRGSVILPGDPDYDVARAVWNARIDCAPAAILQAANVADVAAAVRFARDSGLPLAVRGGGHHPAGYGTVEAGLVLDLSGMKGIAVDAEAHTARIEAGVTAGEFYHAIHARGFTATVGSHPTVGMAGLTLGGGMGLLMGKYGLACDNLLFAEVVAADGHVYTASETENPDLFWAIRGGGGNFGVVTSLTFRIHPGGMVLGGMIGYPMAMAGQVLRFFREFMKDAPDELGAAVALMTTPEGHPACGVLVCYDGPVGAGEKLLARLRAFGTPVIERVAPMPYTVLLDMFKDADPAGGRYAYAARHLTGLSDDAIDAIAEFGMNRTSPGTAVVVYHQHGAAARVPEGATAYAARGVEYTVGIYAGWDGDGSDDACHLDWCAGFRAALEPHAVGAGYLNLSGECGQGDVRAAHCGNYPRLRHVKRAWDPDNLFRRNPNITPAPI